MTVGTAIWLVFVVFFSATVQGFLGFGSGLVGMALIAPVIGARDANLTLMPLAGLLAGLMCFRLRRHVAWDLVGWAFLGSMVGTPIGVWVLAVTREALLAKFLGVTILLFASYSLANPRYESEKISSAWGIVAGLISGFFSGSTSTGGPTVAIFFLILGLEKDRMKASLSAFFVAIVAYKMLVVVLWKGLLTTGHLFVAAPLCAMVLAGMAVGMYAAGFVSSAAMRKAICVFLFFPGLLLLLR